MVCRIIDECRCFAYEGETKQFCGKRRGPHITPCQEDCCFGGCPDDGTRMPFRIIKHPEGGSVVEKLDRVDVSIFILASIVVLFGLLYIDLKVRQVR